MRVSSVRMAPADERIDSVRHLRRIDRQPACGATFEIASLPTRMSWSIPHKVPKIAHQVAAHIVTDPKLARILYFACMAAALVHFGHGGAIDLERSPDVCPEEGTRPADPAASVCRPDLEKNDR